MITVVLSYPNGERREVLLAGVPRVGDLLRLKEDSATDPSLVTELVLWMEGTVTSPEPSVIVVVRPRRTPEDR